MTSFRSKLLASTLLLGAAFTQPAFAQSTSQPADDPASATQSADGTGDSGEVVVTGSRIARPELEASSPVTTVSQEQIAITGTTTLENLINELPQVIPGNTRVSNNSGGENFATLDLRGLGPGRTLILLNGERLPPSTTTGVTDISQIPTGLIQRVDVVTGGASAVYGSDAIAGVVNFILRDDYQGMELTAQTGIAQRGVGFDFSTSGILGGNFADGKGNITLYASYYDRDAVSQSRFGYSRTSSAIYFAPTDANGFVTGQPVIADNAADVPTGYTVAQPGGSATTNFTSISPSTLGGTNFRNLAVQLPGQFAGADTDCNPATAGVNVNGGTLSFNDNGQLSPFFSSGFGSPGLCAIPDRSIGSSRYNFAPQNYLITPYNRTTFTALAKYELDESTMFRFYGSFTQANQQVNLAPTPATGITVPTTAFGIPASLATALANRSFFTRTGRNDTVFSPPAGFTGTATAFGGLGTRAGTTGTCNADADGDGVADFVCTEVNSGNFNSAAVQGVLPGTINPGIENFIVNRRFTETGPRDGRFKTGSINLRGIVEHDFGAGWKGTIVGSYGRVDNTSRGIGNINNEAVAQGIRGCANSAGVVGGPGVLPGCVPINLFAALTPAMINFVRIDTQEQARFEQVRGAANLVGTLFDLPAGPVGVALGAEYRKDTAENVVDDEQRRGNIYGFNAVQSIAGSINVKEVYGEIRVPILSRGDGGEMLSVGAGARYSDYSSVGGLFNWKAEAEFAPFRALRIRGTYNRAARAPNVFELFQNGDQGFPSYTDPCNSATGVRSGNLAALCPTGPFAAANSQVQAFSFGNPNLSEEKAETWTAGAVFNVGRLFGGNMNLTADYYNIKLTNRVAALGAQFFLNDCYQQGVADSCARITRDATGQVVGINTTVTNNPDPFTTAGVDVGFDWSIPFNLFGEARLTISDSLTYVDKYNLGGLKLADTVFSGLGGNISRWANTATVAYRTDKFTTQVRYVYKNGGRQNFDGSEFGATADNGGGFFVDSSTARIPDLHLVNLSLRYQVSDHFELTGIVDNLLDKLPPQTVTGNLEQANTNISFYDPYALGRTFTVQARVRF